MKKYNVTIGLGFLVCFAGFQALAEPVVYEGFDYTEDSAIWGLGTGDGWDGNWVGTDTDVRGTPVVKSGLSFTNLAVTGGAYGRPERYGVAESSRQISAPSQATLTADNTTIWFSVLMESNPGGAGGGFSANSHGVLVFGDTALTTANPGTTPPTIGTGGSAFGVSFDGDGGNTTNNWITGVTYDSGTRSVGTDDRVSVGFNTVMVVGSIDWAENGTDDVMSLYNVTDPTAPLPEAFTTMSADLDQSAFNLVAIGQGQTEVFDEIRFGTSPYDAGMVPASTNPPVIMIEYTADGVTVGATNLVYAGTNYLQYSADLVNGSWSNLYSAVGVTEASWEIATSNTSGAVFYRIETGK